MTEFKADATSSLPSDGMETTANPHSTRDVPFGLWQYPLVFFAVSPGIHGLVLFLISSFITEV